MNRTRVETPEQLRDNILQDAVKPEPTSGKGKKEKATIERWVSRSFAQHSIVVPLPDPTLEGSTSSMVAFENYNLTLDLSEERDKAISEELHSCGREGRDIFVLGAPYGENELGKRSKMLKMLRDMDVSQLRGMVSLDDFVEYGIPPTTRDLDDLIMIILKTTSIDV